MPITTPRLDPVATCFFKLVAAFKRTKAALTLRRVAISLLLLNFYMYVVALGISAWAINRIIDHGSFGPGENSATPYLVLFALLAGVVGTTTCWYGILHISSGGLDSLSVVSALASLTWSLTALAFGFACKHIRLSTLNGQLKTVEAMEFILSATMLCSIWAIHRLANRAS